MVTEGTTTQISVPGLIAFWTRGELDFASRYLQFSKLNTSRDAQLIRLTGRGMRDIDKIEWVVDPEKGFCFISQKKENDHAYGHSLVSVSYELMKAKTNHWIPQKVIIKSFHNGEIAQHTNVELIADSVKVNEKFDAHRFDLSFPKGTEVTNTNQKTTYIEGGGTSRDRESVTRLASEATQLNALGSTAAPGAVAPNAGALTTDASSRSLTSWIAGLTLLLLIGVGVRWQQRRKLQ